MKMKIKKITALLLLLIAFTYSSAQTWTQKNDFIESYLDNTVVVNNEGYVLIPYDINGEFSSRIYKYNQSNDSWSVVSTLPGVPRQGAALFSIGTKIYVAGGLPMAEPPHNYLKNTMFEYDLINNTWEQKSNIDFIYEFFFTGYSTYSHSYNGKGYVFVSGGANKIVEYNPITDTYIEKTACPSTTITGGKKFSFISGNKIYVGLGSPGNSYDELWEYNITSDSWVQKTNSPQGYNDCLSFVINDNFYIGTGIVDGANNYLFYKYNIPTNTWTQITDPVQFIKVGGFAFAIDNKAYACGGVTVSEVWEFDPSILGNNKYSTNEKTKLYPNPVKNNGVLNIESEKACSSYKIYSLNGSIVTKGNVENNRIKLTNLSKGTYLVTLVFENEIHSTHTLLIE
jgi:N-acetylneuraminic acid mutarotase